MTQAVIVSTARTPIGRAYRGALNDIRSPTLMAHSIRHAVARSGVDPAEIDDVVIGSVLNGGSAGMNLARTALLAARGIGTDYHFNQIVGWKIARDGAVTFHGET